MKKLSVLCAFCFLLSALAYTNEDTSNANYLADQGIVTKQSTSSKYRLDDKILRQEVIGMALKVKGITLPENYTCKKYFTDATKNDWVCRAVELAADNGIITKSNKYANPGKDVTRAEALAMIIAQYNIDPFPEVSPEWNTWQQEVARKYIGIWVQNRSSSDGFTIKDVVDGMWFTAQWRPNSLATRAEVFAFAKNILNISWDQSYEWFTADFWGDVDMSEGWYWFGDLVNLENTPVRDFYITIQSRKLASIYDPGSTPLMEKYWNHNMYYTTMIEGMCFTGKLIFLTDEYVISASWACNQTILEIEEALRLISFNPNNTEALQDKDVIGQYYRYLAGQYIGSIYSAYDMRSPAGVSFETFSSWYENTESVTFREDTLKSLGDNTYEFLVDMTESGVKSTYKVKSKVNLEKFTIDNISSVKQ